MEAGLVQILEGALLAAGEPLSVQRMALLFEENERPSKDDIRAAIKTVEERCEDRGYELVQVASGYRFQVRQNLSTWVGRLWQERPARYSRALMETLSLIAYRQPITRGEIEEIRGVAVSTNIIKTLLEREWVRVVGHRDVPGRPAMYATTRQFLDYFNLKSLDQLQCSQLLFAHVHLSGELALESPPESNESTDEESANPAQSVESAETEATNTTRLDGQEQGGDNAEQEQSGDEDQASGSD